MLSKITTRRVSEGLYDNVLVSHLRFGLCLRGSKSSAAENAEGRRIQMRCLAAGAI